jgi:hypothetical protein
MSFFSIFLTKLFYVVFAYLSAYNGVRQLNGVRI